MPHAGGRQECEHGEEAETMGKGFERERVCKVNCFLEYCEPF